MDDYKLMSVAVLQDNNHLRFPISTLSLSPIVDYDYSLIVNKRQTFHPQICVQDPVEDNEANRLNGMVNRYIFPNKRANRLKTRRRQRNNSIYHLNNKKPLYDKNLTFEWYSNQSDINIGQDSISQRFEEDSRLITDQYQSIMERIKPSTMPIQDNKFTQQTPINKKLVTPKYLESKKQEQLGAVIYRHRDTIFIPQNLVSPDLMDQKKLGFLKEIIHLRNMHNKNISKSTPKVSQTQKEDSPAQAHKAQYLPTLQSERLRSFDEQFVHIKMDHNGLTIKNTKPKLLSKDNSLLSQKDLPDTVSVTEMQQISLPNITQKDPHSNKSQQSISIQFKDQYQPLTKEEKKKQKLLEQRRKKILQMQGKIQFVESAESESSLTEEEVQEAQVIEMEAIMQAQRAKLLQDEMKSCHKHAVMIKKIKGLTKKIMETHAKNSKSFSLERVMKRQINIINNLNSRLPRISKNSMQELQNQFVSVLQPLKGV